MQLSAICHYPVRNESNLISLQSTSLLPVSATCPTHPTFLALITLIMFGGNHRSYTPQFSPSFCHSFLLGTSIFLGITCLHEVSEYEYILTSTISNIVSKQNPARSYYSSKTHYKTAKKPEPSTTRAKATARIGISSNLGIRNRIDPTGQRNHIRYLLQCVTQYITSLHSTLAEYVGMITSPYY